MQVLVAHLHDLKRASEYASKVDEAPVWSELGHAQLHEGLIADAISSYLRSGDSSNYLEVRKGGREVLASRAGEQGWWGWGCMLVRSGESCVRRACH